MSLLSDKQIQAQVSSIRRTLKHGCQHFAIRSAGNWTGPDHLTIDGAEHLIFDCVSDLQIREAMIQADRENKPSVLLCSMSDERLGDDVLSRIAKQKVFAPQLKEMIGELFAVRVIDPRVTKTKPLMQGLLDHVPAQGYPPVPGGSLDLQTAWVTLLGRIMGETVESPSLSKLLEWSLSPQKLRRLSELNAELKEALVDWLVRSRGEAARFMMAAIDAGFGKDLIALGAVMGLVYDGRFARDPEHQVARGRLEKFLGGRVMDPEAARVWARTSETVLAQRDFSQEALSLRPILHRTDELVADLGLQDHAWASDWSLLGLEQRYQQAGEALIQALAGKSASALDEVRSAIAGIRKHFLGKDDADRLERLEMACRLIRWLQVAEPTSGANFEQQVVDYHMDGGFLDWARGRLKETDESKVVQQAFDAILKRVDQRARSFEKDFAVHLQDWTKSEHRPSRFHLIEDVLAEVVTPVAKQQPVLLLVLDGMSVAVFRQLLHDLMRSDWSEIARDDSSLPKPVLAALPSVTAVSRRALFLGKLDPSTGGTEQGEFQKNDLLFKGSGGQVRQQLFRIGDLTDEDQGGVADSVVKAISDKKCRVVAVVLNAIDDHLDSGKQVDFAWRKNTIRPLKDLLRQASEAGRLVILTSDHGHVLDFGTKLLPSPKDDRGDRFRAPTGEAEEGELEFEGSRVFKATGRAKIVLPWSDQIRYGKDKRGYHGGANPQEMVVPMAILADTRTTPPEGWEAVVTHQPAWWRLDSPVEAGVQATPQKPSKAVAGLDLFEHAQVKVTSVGPTWIDSLLASPYYAERSKLAVRGAPEVALMTKLLHTLDSRGGSILKQSLAQELGMPPFRVDGLIQNVIRILNVDGYEVLALDASDTVTLNTKLLRTQFDLKEQ
jgi:hypothetical protein